MTKEKFLEMINNSIVRKELKWAEELNTKEQCEYYLSKMEGILCAVEEDAEINFSSLKPFEKADSFNSFIRENDRSANGWDNINKTLYGIMKELETWKRDYTKTHPEQDDNAMKTYQNYSNWYDKKAKGNNIFFWVMMVSFVLGAAVATTFAILETVGVIDTSHIAEICGIVDFFFGVVFFVAEKVDDWKKEKMKRAADRAIQNGEVKEFVYVNNSKKIIRFIKFLCCSCDFSKNNCNNDEVNNDDKKDKK
jgi:hypothetical protein